jgi:hypothetical protein
MLQENFLPHHLGGLQGPAESRGAAPGGRGRPPGSGVPPRCPRRGGLGPKMRHLVLYKLAGFPTADKVPLFGELCYGKNRVFKKTFARNGQKSSFFALFWPKNALFSHFLAPRVPPEQNPIFGGFAPPTPRTSREPGGRRDAKFGGESCPDPLTVSASKIIAAASL